jgi:diacylglycerol kinase (ATP)
MSVQETVSAQSIVLAINPAAAGGRGAARAEHARAVLSEHGYPVVSLVADSAEDLVEKMRGAVASEPRALVAVGGDGTVNAAINALAPDFSIPLGIIPVGTGNDIAESWGIPLDTDAAISHLHDHLNSAPHQVDLAVTHHADRTSYFAAVYSAGFDAIVNERANSMRFPRGSSRYVFALLRELSALRPRRYVVSVDGHRREVEALLIAVANGPSFGGGMKVVPEASVIDGELEVFIVHPLPTLTFLKLFPKVFSGQHVGHPAVEIVPAKQVSLDVDHVIGYADGERQDALPVNISVAPKALSVIA